MTTASFRTDPFTPDRLVAQNASLLLNESIVLATNQNLKRGAVLGRATAGGKYKLSASAATDGTEVPAVVLAVDTDSTGGDKQTVAYTRGDFDSSAITLGAGHTVASIKDGLRLRGIQLINTIGGV